MNNEGKSETFTLREEPRGCCTAAHNGAAVRVNFVRRFRIDFVSCLVWVSIATDS